MRIQFAVLTAVLLIGAALAPARSAPPDTSAGKPPPAAAKPAAPLLGVVNSPLAQKWLDRAGIQYSPVTSAGLSSPPPAGLRLLVLPLEAVTTSGAAESVRAHVAAGGKLVAVYWGTLGPAGGETGPLHSLGSLLGVRPVGWTPEPAPCLLLNAFEAGVMPYSGALVPLARSPAVVAEPLPGTRVLARWAAEDGTAQNSSRSGGAFLRGNVLYLASNLLRPASDSPAGRELFFWALQRVAPDIGPGLQARDRIATAASACGALASALSAATPPELRSEVERALAHMAEARAQLTLGRAARASFAADRARALALELAPRVAAQNEKEGE